MNNWFFYGGLYVLYILMVLALGSNPAKAQTPQCGNTSVMHYQLMERYGEELRETREADVEGGVIELWANPDNGSFSILIYPREGQACMVGAGQHDSLIEHEA